MSINVWTKKPGEPFRHVRMKNEIKTLQKYVGGYIETLTFKDDPRDDEWAVCIMNEEGLLLNLERNATIAGHTIVGNLIIAGVEGEEFADAPEWVNRACEEYNRRME